MKQAQLVFPVAWLLKGRTELNSRVRREQRLKAKSSQSPE
jgi:hypothetical protein